MIDDHSDVVLVCPVHLRSMGSEDAGVIVFANYDEGEFSVICIVGVFVCLPGLFNLFGLAQEK